MNTTVISNIGGLCLYDIDSKGPLLKEALSSWEVLENAYLLIEDGKIAGWGKMEDVPPRAEKVIDAEGGFLLPGFVDSHTHMVFAGSREKEFVGRIKGLSYEQIINEGGGILNSAQRLRDMPYELLLESSRHKLNHLISMGTTALEIKSGYGLSVDGELKMLKVIKALKESSPIPIKSSFLGAHAIPLEYRANRVAYLDLLINDLLPKIAQEGLADYMDVFCEKVAFSIEETDRLLEAGTRYGLKPKIHTNQFNSMGGIQTAIRHNAVSVDHLEVMNEEEIVFLAQSSTIGTLLPSAPFFLSDPYPEGRKLIDAGAAVALASDYNPGSSPSANMSFVISLACVKCGLLPKEALAAATVNGAYALEMEDKCGSIEVGKRADFILTKKVSSLDFLPYSFGHSWISKVFVQGREFVKE